MTRSFSLALASLVLVGQEPAFVSGQGQQTVELAGIWRQETRGGVSYWELTPKGDHTYTAQEYGLGGVRGTASLEDGHLVICFEHEGDHCYYSWHLKGVGGQGRFVRKTGDGGQEVLDNSFVRFIGR